MDVPISYIVTYFGENITNGSITVTQPMATFNLRSVDSDISVFVTAVNVFVSGPDSNVIRSSIRDGELCMLHNVTQLAIASVF